MRPGKAVLLAAALSALAAGRPPDQVVPALRLANASISRGDYAAAAALMNRHLVQMPDDHAAMMVLARALFRDGHKNEGLTIIDGILAHDPDDKAAIRLKSSLLAEMNQLPKALWAAEREIAADPVAIKAYYTRAEILGSMGDWPAAAVAYEDILRRYPDSVRAIGGLAYALEAKGDHAGALARIRRIEELIAPSVSPYVELHKARVLAGSGRIAAAYKLLGRLAEDRRTLIPALLYRGISRSRRGDCISAESFRAHMRELKKKGYQTLTVSQLALIFQEKADLPEKPILLTFDGGRADSFENADPVLKEMGFRATMFTPVSPRRGPYVRAGPKEIAGWLATGRWDVQAHGLRARDPVPVDGFGRQGRFLSNRMWLARSGRLETLEEYRTRAENDYREAKRGVEALVPGKRVVAFSFPFGDYGRSDSNTPGSAAINQALVSRRFLLAFGQDEHGMNTLASNPTDLKRFAVPRHMTAEELAAHLVLSDPRAQAKLLREALGGK